MNTETIEQQKEPATDATPKQSNPKNEDESSDTQNLDATVEAIIITSDKPLSAAKIAEFINLTIEQGGSKPIVKAVDRLNQIYQNTGRTFRIERVAGGYRLMTLPDYAEAIAKQKQARSSSKLSQAALETLAIVAYRQPITRADVEIIRGVSCGEVLRSLLEKHLIKITGRAEEVGRPMLYGSTRYFLEAFGLSTLKDLPDTKELQQP